MRRRSSLFAHIQVGVGIISSGKDLKKDIIKIIQQPFIC